MLPAFLMQSVFVALFLFAASWCASRVFLLCPCFLFLVALWGGAGVFQLICPFFLIFPDIWGILEVASRAFLVKLQRR